MQAMWLAGGTACTTCGNKTLCTATPGPLAWVHILMSSVLDEKYDPM